MMGGTLTRAFGSSMGARLVTAVANYGLFWALSHLLDRTGLGGFSLLTNTFFAIQMLPLLGLSLPLIRRTATEPARLEREVTAAFGFALPVGLLLCALVGTLGGREHPDLGLPFWLIAATLIPGIWCCIAESVLVGRERFAELAWIILLETLTRTFLALLSVRFGGGLIGLSASFLAARCVAMALHMVHRSMPWPRLAMWSAALQRRNWHEVPVYFVISIASVVVNRLDLIVLSSLDGLAEVGVYAAASRLYEATQMLPTVLALVIMPLLARQFVAARERFDATLAVALRLSLTLGLAAALPVYAYADAVIAALYKPEMAGAAGALRWHVFGAVLMVADVLLSVTMQAAKAQRDDLRALLANVAALTLGLYLLIPRFGARGAAAAVVLGLVVRLGLRLRWSVRTLGLPSMGLEVLRLTAATGLAVVVAREAARQGPWFAAGAALAVYVVLIVASGGFGRRPLVRLRADLATLTQRSAS